MRLQRSQLLSLVLVALSQTATAAIAATYYVSPNGNDQSSGLTPQLAFKTLQHASDVAVAGDIVDALPGDYGAGFIRGWDDRQDGRPDAWVTFHGDAGARITGRNNKTPDNINLEASSYTIIEGFEILNAPRAGIRAVTSDHITIRNVNSHDNGVWAIITGHVDDFVAENNIAAKSGQQHGIYVGNSGDRPILRGNTIWGNSGCGIHMNGDESQGGDGIISNAIVENNIIYDNGRSGGSAINCDGVQDSIIRNNLIYNAHASGISLYDIDAAEPAKRNLVVNNTVLVASDGRWALNIKSGSTNTRIFNNILFSAHPARGAISFDSESRTGSLLDNNLLEDRITPDDDDSYLTVAQWKALSGQDQHSAVLTSPEIALPNIAQGDFVPTAGSPAVDQGSAAVAPDADQRGISRPQGAADDIGALELASSGGDGSGGGGGSGGGDGGSGGGNSGGPLDAPSNLTASYDVSTHDVIVQWTDNSTAEQGFQIERSSNSVKFSKAAKVRANVIGFAERVKPKKREAVKYYRVFGYIGSGKRQQRSPYSEVVSVIVPAKSPRGRH